MIRPRESTWKDTEKLEMKKMENKLVLESLGWEEKEVISETEIKLIKD